MDFNGNNNQTNSNFCAGDHCDLQFAYNSTDIFPNEISEFYSYSEYDELLMNVNIYENQMKKYNISPKWRTLSNDNRKSVVMKLLDQLEVCNELIRMDAAKSILYIAQGCWSEVETIEEQQELSRNNVVLLYQLGTFNSFVDLLNFESETIVATKENVTLEDSQRLRVILSVLYLITETLRNEKNSGSKKFKNEIESFMAENDEQLIIKLFNMITEFCDGSARHFPIKKLLLLLWKLILLNLGDFDTLRRIKNDKRKQANLNQYEDTIEVTKSHIETHCNSNLGLRWTPKVQQHDINKFLNRARLRFVGYSLQSDSETLAGLPQPICENIQILRAYVYKSLAELQIQKEADFMRNPLTTTSNNYCKSILAVEGLYQAMLPNMSQYMICLLKLLLVAIPTSNLPVASIDVIAEIIPEEMPLSGLLLKKFEIDRNRHNEIIVKAISAIILLLLKHFKLNHVYQFEYLSRHLIDANCLPLILKFFNQNMTEYVKSKNLLATLEFPSFVIGGNSFQTNLEKTNYYNVPSWRNMFSSINLLRILNKLTKWKQTRILVLVALKSVKILKPALEIKHQTFQLYILKLFKMQMKYLGRLYRKQNMPIINAIYQKVRHRLNDDWAYTNDLHSRPWDYQKDEFALRCEVDKFNNFRYKQTNESNDDYCPVDNSLSVVLQSNDRLTEEFKKNYQLWLEEQVFGNSIEWEKV